MNEKAVRTSLEAQPCVAGPCGSNQNEESFFKAPSCDKSSPERWDSYLPNDFLNVTSSNPQIEGQTEKILRTAINGDTKTQVMGSGEVHGNQPREKERPQRSLDPTLLYDSIDSGLKVPQKVANLPEVQLANPVLLLIQEAALLASQGSKL